MQAPPTAARTFTAVVLVLVAGIVVGRLVLERTGSGLVVLAVALPIVFVIGLATLGAGRAAFLLGLFAGTALLIRVVVLETGWVVLLLVPALALTAYILANTLRVLIKGKEEGPGV